VWRAGNTWGPRGPAPGHADRFFVPKQGLCGVFPLLDAPGQTWVECDAQALTGCAFWTRPAGWADTTDVTIEDLNVLSNLQSAVMVGDHQGLTISHVTATGGAHGIGSFPRLTSWPTVIEDRCFLSGYDAGLFLYGQTMWASIRDLQIPVSGRDGVRLMGVNGKLEHVGISRPPAWAETALRILPIDDGVRLDVERVTVDNEGGATYSDSILYTVQGPYAGTWVDVNKLVVSGAPVKNPVFRLKGFGIFGAYDKPSRFSAINTDVWSANPTLFQADPGWVGTIEGQAVVPAAPAARR
jgi:hypothetical protein